jgi:phytoene dehydrogenase-like protein
MTEGPPGERRPRDATYWARSRNVLRVSEVPEGAVNLNVEGRRPVGALQGFGQLWKKTYTVRLEGASASPAEVVRVWKREFPTFHPPHSRFYPPLEGVAPGEVLLINASVQGMPVYTGVMVLYADDESFTVMTAEGLPEAGWNTFAAHEGEDGTTVATVQSLARANDPIYEVGFRLFGSTAQERIWVHVLQSLAARFGVEGIPVSVERDLVDPNLQWSRAKNIWHNASARSVLYTATSAVSGAARAVRSVASPAARPAPGGESSRRGWRAPARIGGMKKVYDAVVVGAGPNGLAAAVELARNGKSVAVLEAQESIGGGTRSAEVTLPGFVHDLGSAVHPLGYASPYFRALPLEEHGLEWVHPPAPLAHPLDGGRAVIQERSVDRTAEGLGPDADAYRRLMQGIVPDVNRIISTLTGDPRLPHHPLAFAVSALRAVRSARGLAEDLFVDQRAKALFAGNAAHSFLPMEHSLSAMFGLVLGTLGHSVGWPFPKGGSQAIADALASYLLSLGGEIYTDFRVDAVEDLPYTRSVLFDLTPRQLQKIAGRHFTERYREALKGYRYGPGVFKVDVALDGPIPWEAEGCNRAGTVHLGATLEEISAGEAAVARGEHPERPFVLLAQQSLFDETRAPEGKHTVWAYCHVPNGSTVDMTERIEAQIERFAPGFRDRILARATMGPAQLERWNANLVGGDINGGFMDLPQFLGRPFPRLNPYSTSAPGLFICSSSTPPGGAVHGLCGFMGARAALRYLK